MFKVWIYLLLIALFLGCQSDLQKSENLTNYLPAETSIYFEGEDFDEIKSSIEESKLISEFTKYPMNDKLSNIINTLKHLNSKHKSVLGFSRGNDQKLFFSLIVKSDSTIFKKDSVQDLKVETFTTQAGSITKYTIDSTSIYSKQIDDIQFYSNNETFTKNFGKDDTSSPTPNRFQKLKSSDKTVVLQSNEEDGFPMRIFLNDSLSHLKLGDRMFLDLVENDNEVYANGVVENIKNDSSYIGLFKNTIPQLNRFSEISPDNIDYAMSVTFDDREVFLKNLGNIFPADSLTNVSWPLNNTIEIAQIEKNSETVIFIQTLDPSTSLSNLQNKSLFETYREVEIYNLNEEKSPFVVFKNLFRSSNPDYFFTIDEFFLFSDNLGLLKECISAYQNENTLSKSGSFEGIMQNMSDEASTFVYYNGVRLNKLIDLNFDEEINLNFKNSERSAIQLITDSDYAHINAVLRKSGKTSSRTSVAEQLQTTIDSEILNGPYFLENSESKSMDYYVQDVNNNLHVFDNKGNVLFKKLLDGPILGRIEQLDSFKNGRKQLAFTTAKTLYVLSRDGKDVSNFPVKFKDQVTQPLSLFDYENNRIYRLLITQGKDLLMMDKDGKRVNGFKFKPNNNPITSQPKHIVLGRKDFIAFKEGDGIRMLSRTGGDRINVSTNFNYSDNELYELDDKFSFTDRTGNLVQIDQNGGITKQDLKIAETHKFVSTSRTAVYLSDNLLKIRTNSVELDFGNYTDPRIFYINDKIYVTITDLQTNKVYLFDSQVKPISGFPVYGSSSIDIGKIDKDTNLEIIVKSGSNGILIYQLN
ncbi:hypothetical protein SAMN03097699_2062 [Flavobacteriaceae bacterium MAR_2010_188]|nr:hypothetical protein SAMN03097699_2062 [Flavobacteriaceae bacterium MAR_2010_188]